MKRRMRPVANARYEVVLYWIVMNVIHVSNEILLVTNRVFPITSLPQCKLAVRMALNRNPRSQQSGAEVSLDAPPSAGEIRISLR